MHISTFHLGPLQTNCYLIDDGKSAVVIDPGGEPGPVLAYLMQHKLTLTHVLCTHLHFDHTYGVAALCQATKAEIRASQHDAHMLQSELGRGGLWGLPVVDDYTFIHLGPGPLPLLGSTCTVLATPGHTPGGLSFYFPAIKAVFAGDTLFARSVGRTDFPGGSSEILSDSIVKQLFTLPPETEVYPGHGESTTIADEKLNNPFVSDFVT